jgi:phospholipid/cholesterol/gamma-HCH transport system substrate-binding protein
MRNALTSAKGRILVLVVFAAAVVAGGIGLLSYTQVFSGHLYHVTVEMKDADNLVGGGQVRIAGIRIGSVLGVQPEPGGAVATLGIQSRFAPLHGGVTVRVGNRSLVEETYLDIKDGSGAPIPDGSVLPPDAVQTSTQIRDVLYSLDPKTRTTLSSMLRSAGSATAGTQNAVGQLFDGLGMVGRQGGDTLEAVSDQGEDLRQLTRDTAVMLRSLDTGQGDVSALVDSANRLTEATSREKPAIEATMVRLPGVLDSAHTASDSLNDLSHSLAPIAANLRRASPGLTDAMHDLPGVTHDLRALMPGLNEALDRAPRALDRVPQVSDDLRDGLFPGTRDILRDGNPMLGYMRKYAPEVAGLISNFNEVIGYTDEAGRETYHVMATGVDTAVGSPVNPGNIGKMDYFNPIPAPGKLRDPGPFDGKFPRVERAPR